MCDSMRMSVERGLRKAARAHRCRHCVFSSSGYTCSRCRSQSRRVSAGWVKKQGRATVCLRFRARLSLIHARLFFASARKYMRSA